jgi:hypothetical protein
MEMAWGSFVDAYLQWTTKSHRYTAMRRRIIHGEIQQPASRGEWAAVRENSRSLAPWLSKDAVQPMTRLQVRARSDGQYVSNPYSLNFTYSHDWLEFISSECFASNEWWFEIKFRMHEVDVHALASLKTSSWLVWVAVVCLNTIYLRASSHYGTCE